MYMGSNMSKEVGITGSVPMLVLHIQSQGSIQLPDTEEGDLIDPRTFQVFGEQVHVYQLHGLFSCRLHNEGI